MNLQNITNEELIIQLEILQKKLKDFENIQLARKNEDRILLRLNHALTTISACNKILVRAKSEFSLLQQICDTLVDIGKYSMAWICFINDEDFSSLQPVAFSGSEQIYRNFSNIDFSNNSNKLGPTGKAIKFIKTQIVNNIAADPDFELWKDTALNNGINSAIALPIVYEGKCFGALTIYSNEQGYFDSNEENLLQELTADLAFGIAALRNQKITEKFQQELKESEENYRKLIEISPNAILVLHDGKCVFLNKTAIKIFGADKYDDLIFKLFIDFVHPDFKVAAIKQMTYAGEKQKNTVREIKLINLKDKVLDLLMACAYTNFKGEPAIQVVLNDITELKSVENSLRDSEQRYRMLFENALVGILKSTEEGQILMANDAMINMLGYGSFEEFSKIKAYEFYQNKNDREVFIKSIKEKKTIKGFETVFLKKDGSPIVIHTNARFVENIENNESFIEGTIEDVTSKHKIEEELIRAKEKAEEISRIKGNFLANMSHELRTPLVSILGFAEIFQNEFSGSVYKEMADSIFNSGNRLLETLNSILDLSKLEANKIELRKKETNVVPIVNECIDRFIPVARDKNLFFKKEIEDEEIKGILDVQLFEKIINHILNNAVKYTIKGGITVQVKKIFEKGKHWVAIYVSDTGIGIPKDNLNTIFEDFRQVSEGLNRNYEGTGIGLTITKKFVQMLDGEIRVESNEGLGSKFIVLLPSPEVKIKENTNEETEHLQIIKNGDEQRNLPNVLLVENDWPTIDVTRILLRKFYNIEIAITGEIALDAVRQKKYDAILMDINLGAGIDGVEAMNKIRELPDYKNKPIAAFTAYAMVNDRAKFLNFGFSDYIAKPFDKKSLLELMDRLFNKNIN